MTAVAVAGGVLADLMAIGWAAAYLAWGDAIYSPRHSRRSVK